MFVCSFLFQRKDVDIHLSRRASGKVFDGVKTSLTHKARCANRPANEHSRHMFIEGCSTEIATLFTPSEYERTAFDGSTI